MAKNLKTVYMGTPEFSIPPLKSLLDHPDINVVAVITQPDKPVGRSQQLTPPPLKIFAEKHNLKVLQPDRIRKNNDFLKQLSDFHPDFVITAAYGKILPEEVLGLPRFGCINIHASLLPRYRGASPIEQALLNGDDSTGITFIKMDERMDTGDILLSQPLQISNDDNDISLRNKLSSVAAGLLPQLLLDYASGTVIPSAQDHKHATYCNKIDKNDGLLLPAEMTAKEIINRIRALNPWPSTFMIFKDKRLKIIEVEKADLNIQNKAPGDFIVYDNSRNLALITKDGVIRILTLQIEGKKPASAQDFLRGNANFFNNSPVSPK